MSMKKYLLAAIIMTVFFMGSCSEDNGPFLRETSSVIFTITQVLPSSDPYGDIQSDNGTIPSDTVSLLFANYLKNQQIIVPKVYGDVILNSVTISFRRTDGGYDVPATVRHGITIRILADGINQLDGVVILPATSKTEFPISDLLFYGYERSTNYTTISMDVIIEVEGHTLEGEPVQARGYTSLILANWAD